MERPSRRPTLTSRLRPPRTASSFFNWTISQRVSRSATRSPSGCNRVARRLNRDWVGTGESNDAVRCCLKGKVMEEITSLTSVSYGSLLVEIKERIRLAQLAALRSVNRELIDLYWDIGRLIVHRQEGETWGRAIVESLARDLR